jgi:RNA polymerase primary sigma factor
MSNYANDFVRTVQTYYDDLKPYKPISRAKERKLIRASKKGNLKAKNELLTSNLRFVFDVARKYTGRGLPISDLISEGNLALIRAIDKFDEKRDVKFISYAVWWVKQAMIESIKKEKVLNNVSFDEEYSDEAFENPTMFDREDEYICTNDTYFSNEKDEEDKELTENQIRLLESVMCVLGEREKDVIESFYGLNGKKQMTLLELGKKYDISSERVRQIKLTAIRKLRTKVMETDGMDELFR